MMCLGGTKEQFDSFVSWLNSLMVGVVKFTANLSYNQVEFLDLLIKMKKEGSKRIY